MEIKINQYQFDNICGQMEREFGKIRKGEEQVHTLTLYSIESNLLKTYWANPSSNSRRLSEAIPITLFEIKSYLCDDEYDLGNFRSKDNERLVQAMLATFDPFTNEVVKNLLEDDEIYDLSNEEDLKKLYTEPILCLLRIKESVDVWDKRMGTNGYFDFLEKNIGEPVSQEDKTTFKILVPSK